MAGEENGAAPRADAEAIAEPSASGIATAAARALVLGAALTAPAALDGMERLIPQIGIERLPPPWSGWEQRVEMLAASDAVLERAGMLDHVRDREIPGYVPVMLDEPGRPDGTIELWRAFRRDPTQAHAAAVLRALMLSDEPTGAAAAAASLSHWRKGRPEHVPPVPLVLAKALTQIYSEWPDEHASDIARAARETDPRRPYISSSRRGAREFAGGSASLIVHGTFAWPTDWWLVGGDFHTYVRDHVRADLFSGHHAYQWSGRFRRKHRIIAAERLARWATDTIGGPLNTVFAHSYGGTIALHATSFGLEMRELVLLSAPVEQVPIEWRHIGRAVSLRIHMDLVLLAARRRQLFTENVDEHHLPAWFWWHSDSHGPDAWRTHDCATTLGL